MKISDQKDLARLIALCRKTGVSSIRVDGIEFHLGAEPKRAVSSPRPQARLLTRLSPRSTRYCPKALQTSSPCSTASLARLTLTRLNKTN